MGVANLTYRGYDMYDEAIYVVYNNNHQGAGHRVWSWLCVVCGGIRTVSKRLLVRSIAFIIS